MRQLFHIQQEITLMVYRQFLFYLLPFLHGSGLEIISQRKKRVLGKILENKWYVDELYENIIVKPLNKLGDFLNSFFERSVIDWNCEWCREEQ